MPYRIRAMRIVLTAIASFAIPGGTALADCLQEFVAIPAGDVDVARRAAPTLAAALKLPPAGWSKGVSRAVKVEDSVAYCEGLEDPPKAPKAKIQAQVGYFPPNPVNGSYIIRLVANEAPKPLPPGDLSYVSTIGNLAGPTRNRVAGIKIIILRANRDGASQKGIAIPPDELEVLKNSIDMVALRGLVAGRIPSQAEADALLAQNVAETPAPPVVARPSAPTQQAQPSQPSQTQSPQSSTNQNANSGTGRAVGDALRRFPKF